MNAPFDLDALERAALAATPQGIDTAQVVHDCEGKTIECPHCQGDGYVELEGDYCNFDGAAIGVQFYGIGNEFGAAGRYYRAANPATILELIRRLRDALRQRDVLLAALKLVAEIPFSDHYRVGAIARSAIADVEQPEEGSADQSQSKSCGKCKHEPSCAESGRHKDCIEGFELRLFEPMKGSSV